LKPTIFLMVFIMFVVKFLHFDLVELKGHDRLDLRKFSFSN